MYSNHYRSQQSFQRKAFNLYRQHCREQAFVLDCITHRYKSDYNPLHDRYLKVHFGKYHVRR